MARAGLDVATVVATAGELADATGLDGLTLTALAARLSIRPPSLYAHVGGLEDLRAQLATLGAERLYESLAPAAAGLAGADALRATLHAYRRFAHEHPGLYQAAQLSGRRGVAPAGAGGRVVELMRAVMRGYGLEGEDAVHAVRAAAHGFVELERSGGFGMRESVADSWERLLTVLDRGLRAAGAGG